MCARVSWKIMDVEVVNHKEIKFDEILASNEVGRCL